MERPPQQNGAPASPADPAPALSDGWTRAILLVALVLQAWAWHRLSGYQLADSVEFMDRAHAVARGETLDSTGAVRSFGFSTLLLPFFAAARWLELEDLRPVVHLVRLFQMALGLGLVAACMRLGWRLGGRRVGWWSGFLVATNPVFLQYSVDPVSGIAAALLVALALEALLVRSGPRRALVGGLLLGGAFIMAYQTLLVAGPLLLLLAIRDRWRGRASWLGAAAGLSVALLAQVALDRLTYGTWGLSITTYVLENAGGVVFTALAFVGLADAEWVREGYARFIETMNPADVADADGERRNLQSPFYYALHLPEMLVWPALLGGAAGVARAVLRRHPTALMLLALLLVNAGAMSTKGSKSFRLWLPLLPMLAPLCAWGLAGLAGLDGEGRGRRWLATVAAVAVLVLGPWTLDALNTRRYGAYWEAMDFVNARAAARRERLEAGGEAVDPETVGAAYDWAVFCRGGADVRVVKFREHLDRWEDHDEEQRTVVLEQLDELDWLIVHGTILRLDPVLSRAVSGSFEVVASFRDEDTTPTIRDVRVLRHLRHHGEEGPRPARVLYEVIEDVEPARYRAERQLEGRPLQPVLLVGEGADGRRERLWLLGYELEPLPGAGFHWITYHWYTDTGFDRDYVLVDRVTTRQCPWAWQNNRVPGYGALPTSGWRPGTVVREGHLFVPGEKPFDPEGWHPLGGSYRRGELLPAMLWVRGESPPPDIDAHLLVPGDPRTGEPLDPEAAVVALEEPGLRTPGGFVLTGDRLVRAGRFLTPVLDAHRWPDDGGPGPDDEEIERARLAELEKHAEGAPEAAPVTEGEAPR
jgi:hypothetical protein